MHGGTAMCMVKRAQCRFLQGAVFAAAIGCVGVFAPLLPVGNPFRTWQVLNFFVLGNVYIIFHLLAVWPLCSLL